MGGFQICFDRQKIFTWSKVITVFVSFVTEKKLRAWAVLVGRATVVPLAWPLSRPPSSLPTATQTASLVAGLDPVVGALLTYHRLATLLSYHA